MIQGTPEWFAARLGRVTASRVADAMGAPAKRRGYLRELVAERLTGWAAEHYVSADMQRGTEREPQARALYSLATGLTVVEVGFVPHLRLAGFGASPDGLVGEDGLVEIKCPRRETHVDTLLEGAIPAQHRPQMLAQMACTGRRWCDFASFCLDMPEPLQLFVRRLDRDDDAIAEMEAAVAAFLEVVEDGADMLRRQACAQDAADPIAGLIDGRASFSWGG